MEIWKSVVGYEGIYEISDLGRVRSLDRISAAGRRLRGKMMKTSADNNGYPSVILYITEPKRHHVHALVLTAFVGPRPENLEACHFNGNREDSRLSNLRWDTRSSNHRDAIRHGTHRGFGQGVGMPPLPLAKRSHCKHGHVITPEKIYVTPSGGTHCRACIRKSAREYAARKRAAITGVPIG